MGVADEFVRVLQELRVILTPVLGVRGVATLLQRSLHAGRMQFPWLADSLADEDFVDLMALQSSLAGEDYRSSRAAADGVLYSFHALLTSLIGMPLTELLLDSASTPPSNDSAGRHHG